MEMEVRDYNGAGAWGWEVVVQRYGAYCRQLNVLNPAEIRPRENVDGLIKWIYPVMDEIIAGIERGDKACSAIHIELVEEDQRMPFGRILKSNAARALRRAELSE